MQIQVNTDDHIQGREALAERVSGEVARFVGRFSERITRIEVHLGDENAAKSGADDKRCLIEARLAGRQPIAVTHHAATLKAALNGAGKKLRDALDSVLGREHDHKGGATIREMPPPD